MIPASMLEKLLSMVIVSVFVVPVAVYVSLTLTDAALYGLSCMGIGQFTGLVLYNPFESPFSLDILTVPVRNVILATAVSISSAIMFNAIFRKNKIIKTVNRQENQKGNRFASSCNIYTNFYLDYI